MTNADMLAAVGIGLIIGALGVWRGALTAIGMLLIMAAMQ